MEKNQENNDIRISSGINLSDDIHEAIEELRNMSNEEVDALMRNTNPPLLTNFNPLAKLNNEELENPFELTEADFDDEFEKHAKAFFKFLNEEPKGTLTNAGLKIIENVKLRENIIKEGLLYGVELDDERCRNGIMEFINCSAKEPSTDELKRKFREVSKFGTIPTEKEFKEEAKKLKVSGNFSSLGAAQNALAKKYGFKEYRAIKNCFKNSGILNIVRKAINQVNEQKTNNFEVAVNELHKLLKEYKNIRIESNLFENIDNINKKIYIEINNKRVAKALGYFDIGRDYFLFDNELFIEK